MLELPPQRVKLYQFGMWSRHQHFYTVPLFESNVRLRLRTVHLEQFLQVYVKTNHTWILFNEDSDSVGLGWGPDILHS